MGGASWASDHRDLTLGLLITFHHTAINLKSAVLCDPDGVISAHSSGHGQRALEVCFRECRGASAHCIFLLGQFHLRLMPAAFFFCRSAFCIIGRSSSCVLCL